MTWVGIFGGARSRAPWLLVVALAALGCSKSDEKLRSLPDAAADDGGANTPESDGGAAPSRPDPFVTQPQDEDDGGTALDKLPPYDVEGTRWKYKLTTTSPVLPAPQTSTRTQTVKEAFTWPDGRDGARHEISIEMEGTPAITGPVPAFAIESDRIVLEEVDGMKGEFLPALETVIPLQVGTRFGPRADANESIVTALEEVTVPAGTYQAYKLEAQWPTSASKSTEWWVEGIGMVRSEAVSPGPNAASPFTTVTELEEFDKP